MGYKNFENLEILDETDLDLLMRQTVMRFADGAERDAQLTDPQEGDLAYLLDGVGLVQYDGTTWTGLKVRRVRLTSTTDADASSTAHAWQIGPDNGANLRASANKLVAVDNGNVVTLFVNMGGAVRMGGLEAGSVTIPSAASSQASQAVSFTAGRFSVAPTVVISIRSTTAAGSLYSKLIAKATSVTASGFTAVMNTGDGSAMSAGQNITCDWIAYQCP